MNEPLRRLDHLVSQIIADETAPTTESIRATISEMRTVPIFSVVTDNDAEMLARTIEERIGVSMGIGAMLEDHEFRPWLHDAKAKGLIEPHYWSRYQRLLQSKGLPRDVMATTDSVTERMLDKLGNPSDTTKWDRRGMVVGHVQSGKTANYIGLVCKAADAGYRLIVVIAGIHNNLRNQTQGRIDEGFIGRDTGRLQMRGTEASPKRIGVGKFDDHQTPVSLTNTIKDFNKATATTNTSQIGSYAVPVVLVIKKNSNTLKNLIEWLREHSAVGGSEMVDQPALLIDDEADNASINIKYGKDEVSRINGQIRTLLGLFRRSCYVGYTATPFANIFIDPDNEDNFGNQDLFPKHFLIGLDAPSNYFGPRTVIIDGGLDDEPTHVRFIDDNEDILPIRHGIDHQVGEVPDSMVRALRAFVVARTIRNLRGQAGEHASMLVNASRFTAIQGVLRNRLHDRIEVITNAVRVDAAKGPGGLRNSEIAALRKVWEEEYSDAHDDWDGIQRNLLPTLAAARVVAINSRSAEKLDYGSSGEIGQTVIAVGGISLSRGLTLEGLTVSYFLRNSMMYDTLMQMSRWFGYRPNYEDLCRIWMRREAADWYAHIAESTEELQAELRRMERDGATPEMFGLAVRSHPSSLIVTARNKMGSGEKRVMVGLSNAFVETTKLSADPDILEHNRSAAREFLEGLGDEGQTQETSEKVPGGFLLRGVPVEHVDGFLQGFRNARESVQTETGPLRKYISDRAENELPKWDVHIASVRKSDTDSLSDILGWSIGPAQRSVGTEELERDLLAISGKRSRVASRGVEKIGIDPGCVDQAEENFRLDEMEKITKGRPINYPDRIYRVVRQRPLLILHLLNVRMSMKDAAGDRLPADPVVAWGVSLPVSKTPHERVEYVLNTTRLRELFGEDDSDEDDFDDDE